MHSNHDFQLTIKFRSHSVQPKNPRGKKQIAVTMLSGLHRYSCKEEIDTWHGGIFSDLATIHRLFNSQTLTHKLYNQFPQTLEKNVKITN